MPNLTGLAAFAKRIQVLATSALSWLTAISAALVILAQQLDGVAGVPEWATRAIASAIAVIATITLQVRRVTPVAPADMGLLPPKGPAVEALPAKDVGQIGLAVLFLVVALVCFVIFALVAHGTFVSDEGFTWLGGGLVSATLAKLVP